jgi:hypothetical protein
MAGSASLILCYGCGGFAGPPLAAGFMELVGPGGLFVFFALSGAMIAALAALASAHAIEVHKEPRATIPVPRTSPVIAEIDPRHEVDSDADGGSAED